MFKEKFDVNRYAHEVATKKIPCLEVGRTLKEHKIEIEKFFIPYTVFKTGKYTEENYKAVLTDFKNKTDLEIRDRWGNHSLFIWNNAPSLSGMPESINIDPEDGLRI